MKNIIIKTTLLISLLIEITGCKQQYLEVDKMDVLINSEAKTQQHKYNISIVDINHHPLNNVKINYKMSMIESNRIISSEEEKTSKDNIIVITKNSFKKKGLIDLISYYAYQLSYTISKDGYYEKDGVEDNIFDTQINTKNIILTMYKKTDYIEPTFLTSINNSKLLKQLSDSINIIQSKNYLVDTIFKPLSIEPIKHKKYKYLKLEFENTNIYNSIQLNEYDIAKILFESTVKKVLNSLDNVTNEDIFYGYDIRIIALIKNFANKQDINKKIIYRYLIPFDTAKKYNNQTISRQELINSSKVLSNNELIKLKFQ